MKNVLKYLLVIVLVLPVSQADAKTTSWHVGLSSSTVGPADFAQMPGITIGHSAEWRLVKYLYIEREYNLSYKRTEMYNKLGYYPFANLSVYKVRADFVYFQVPVFLKLAIPTDRSSLKIYAGPSALLCISDDVNLSQVTELERYQEAGEPDPIPNHDFTINIEHEMKIPMVDSSTWGYSVGIQFMLWWTDLDIRYSLSKLRRPEIYDFRLDFHTVELLVSF